MRGANISMGPSKPVRAAPLLPGIATAKNRALFGAHFPLHKKTAAAALRRVGCRIRRGDPRHCRSRRSADEDAHGRRSPGRGGADDMVMTTHVAGPRHPPLPCAVRPRAIAAGSSPPRGVTQLAVCSSARAAVSSFSLR
jgi:hypothetical protein